MSDSTAKPNGHEPDNTDHLEASKARAKAAAAEMRGAAAEIRGAAVDAARDIKDRAGAVADEWKGKADGLHKDIETYVREKPTQSLLAALGVGFVVGLIFRR